MTSGLKQPVLRVSETKHNDGSSVMSVVVFRVQRDAKVELIVLIGFVCTLIAERHLKLTRSRLVSLALLVPSHWHPSLCLQTLRVVVEESICDEGPARQNQRHFLSIHQDQWQSVVVALVAAFGTEIRQVCLKSLMHSTLDICDAYPWNSGNLLDHLKAVITDF